MDCLKSGKFSIVKFINEDDALGVIPFSWIGECGSYCFYPNATSEARRNKLTRDEAEPTSEWSTHSISIMKTYGSYKEARENLRRAEETSNLDSDEEENSRRKRKQNNLILPGEESSEEDSQVIKKKKTCRRNLHPYPSLESFSKNAEPQREFQEQIVPGQLNKTPTERSTPLNTAQRITSGSMRVKSSAFDPEHLYVVLSQIQATVADLSHEIAENSKKLDSILSQGIGTSSSEATKEDEYNIIRNLPLGSLTEFDTFEESINDLNIRKTLIKFLVSVGGKCPKTMIYSLMKRCMLSELGIQFSLSGKAGKGPNINNSKRAFATTNICSAIHCAVRRVYNNSATDDVLKLHTGHWLQQSKNRLQSNRNSCMEIQATVVAQLDGNTSD